MRQAQRRGRKGAKRRASREKVERVLHLAKKVLKLFGTSDVGYRLRFDGTHVFIMQEPNTVPFKITTSIYVFSRRENKLAIKYTMGVEPEVGKTKWINKALVALESLLVLESLAEAAP